MRQNVFLFQLSGLILSVALFSAGFFRQLSPIGENGEDLCLDKSNANKSKLVLIVIDAFAFDFVDEHAEELRFLKSRVDKGDLFLKAHVQTPTVTLPRLKVWFLV